MSDIFWGGSVCCILCKAWVGFFGKKLLTQAAKGNTETFAILITTSTTRTIVRILLIETSGLKYVC